MVQLDWKLKTANVITFLATLVSNGYLGNFGDKTIGDISHEHPTAATPANWAFGVWGVIYFLLTGLIIYQFFRKAPQDALGDGISYWFALSSVLNTAWVVLWTHEYLYASALVIVWLAATLTHIYWNLGSYPPRGPFDFFFINAPFSIYTAWLSVASLINFLVVAKFANNSNGGAVAILFVSAIGVYVVNHSDRKDILYAGTILWAVSAVAENHKDDSIVLTASFFSMGALSYSIMAVIVPRFFKVLRRRLRRGERAPLLVR